MARGSSSSLPGGRAGLALRPGRDRAGDADGGSGDGDDAGGDADAGVAGPAAGWLKRLRAMARARTARSSALCPYSIAS
jgi:hypothetical protein